MYVNFQSQGYMVKNFSAKRKILSQEMYTGNMRDAEADPAIWKRGGGV